VTDSSPKAARRFSLGRLIDDFFVLATGQFLSKVFGFLAFAWLARKLTTADYGAVETAVGMAAIGTVALELGTGAVGVRRLAQKESAAPEILGSVISARLTLAVAVAPLLALGYAAATKSSYPDILFWVFAASLFAVPFNHNWFFQSQEKMAAAGFGQTLKMGAFLLCVILFAPQRNGVSHVAYAEAVAAALMAIWYSTLAFFHLRGSRLHYGLQPGFGLLRESAPVGASAFVNALAQYLPVLIVAALASEFETAQFGAAQRLVLSLVTFSFIYYFNLFPLIAGKLVDEPAALSRIVAASVRVTAWIGFSLSALLWALAPVVMRLVFGKNFETAGAEFGLLVWSGAFILASGHARWLLVAGKRQNSLLAAQIVNACVGVGACLAFAPRWGGIGAAAACVLGALALWAAAHWRAKDLAVSPPLRANAAAAFTALAAVGVVLAVQPGPAAGAGLAAAVLALGMAADRQLFASLRILSEAKSR
jgi:O-antigen/teichoic acid export membrane protein